VLAWPAHPWSHRNGKCRFLSHSRNPSSSLSLVVVLFFDRRRQQLARMSFQILGAREQMDFDIAGASDFSKESEIPED
jgi:hypothetical protein